MFILTKFMKEIRNTSVPSVTIKVLSKPVGRNMLKVRNHLIFESYRVSHSKDGNVILL